jgi:hypothetical protein
VYGVEVAGEEDFETGTALGARQERSGREWRILVSINERHGEPTGTRCAWDEGLNSPERLTASGETLARFIQASEVAAAGGDLHMQTKVIEQGVVTLGDVSTEGRFKGREIHLNFSPEVQGRMG